MGVKLARVIYGFLVTVVTMHSYVINSYTVVSINSIKNLLKKIINYRDAARNI